jgi:thiosulfate dehydrogenase [quinone] large subunit
VITPQKNRQITFMPGWVLLPLRLFLGITFFYAGIQKILDPQFFNPHATGFIGRQIIGFANGSPLHGFFTWIVEPHAVIFGLLIIFAEILIGSGMLFGLLLRPAAFFGLLLSLVFYLSASWHVYPYFYGADIVFVFCWLTLLLNGPLNTGLPTIDAWLTKDILENLPTQRQVQLAPFFAIVLGTTEARAQSTQSVQTVVNKAGQPIHTQTRLVRKNSLQQRARDARRNFLLGALTGGLTVLGIAAISYATSIKQRIDAIGAATPAPVPQPPTPIGTPATGTTPTGNAIAQVSAVPSNSAVTFTIPTTGDPGVLVHLDNGQFVAYDALCTHAGCQVDYDPSAKLLVCPCHGAAFDPAKQATVVNPPANTPLETVTIHVDSATGAITLA